MQTVFDESIEGDKREQIVRIKFRTLSAILASPLGIGSIPHSLQFRYSLCEEVLTLVRDFSVLTTVPGRSLVSSALLCGAFIICQIETTEAPK